MKNIYRNHSFRKLEYPCQNHAWVITPHPYHHSFTPSPFRHTLHRGVRASLCMLWSHDIYLGYLMLILIIVESFLLSDICINTQTRPMTSNQIKIHCTNITTDEIPKIFVMPRLDYQWTQRRIFLQEYSLLQFQHSDEDQTLKVDRNRVMSCSVFVHSYMKALPQSKLAHQKLANVPTLISQVDHQK